MKANTVFDCTVLQLNKIASRSGNITFINNSQEIPFETKRVFYIYDIPGGGSRGAHSHRSCHQFLVAASGSFEIQLDDGSMKKRVRLNRPFLGLHIPPMIWASEINFSSGAVCLVLASQIYSAEDYIRDYTEFLGVRDTIYK
jgi:hypothetical protein